MEMFQHYSPHLGLLLQAFRPHGPSQVTASGNVQVRRLNSPLRYRRSWPCLGAVGVEQRHGVMAEGSEPRLLRPELWRS
jgi:hypothetical protein